MLKKTILGIAIVFLMSIIALGIVSASPNSQAGTGHESFTFLLLAIEDANDKGLMSDELNSNLYEHVIESLTAPYTFETPEEVEERLSEDGQTSFEILVAVLTDANDKGILSEYLIDVLTDLFVEELIANHTGETPEQVARRLSALTIPTPTAVPSATPLPMTVTQVVKNVEKAVVLVERSGGSGTGFIIDAGGRLITNAHVVGRDPRVLVIMHDETVYEADVLGIDEIADLAVVQLPPGRLLYPVPLGDSDLAQVGDEVIAMGYPLGFKTVTTGIVSATNVVFSGVEHIQTDAAINPGNSGGPLLNGDGHVIGINVGKFEETASGRPVDNIGFAITVNELKARLDDLSAGLSVLDPTPPPVPDPADGWMRYKNGEYGYSIDIPPAWSFTTEFEDEKYAHFRSSDSQALTEVRAYDIPDSFSLREFAEQRRDALNATARSGSVGLLEVKTIERMDETADEYYEITYRYQPTPEVCVSDVTERVRVSSLHPTKPYGFGMTVSVCEDSLEDYVFDRDAIMDTFLEWHMYASPTFGYSINLAPNWHLAGLAGGGARAVIFPEGSRAGFVDINVYNTDDTVSLEDFAKFRESEMYQIADEDEWEELDHHFLKEREQVEGRKAYVSAYTARRGSNRCLAGLIDLIALSSYYPDNTYGYVVITGVCLSIMDVYNEDRLEMLDSFRY